MAVSPGAKRAPWIVKEVELSSKGSGGSAGRTAAGGGRRGAAQPSSIPAPSAARHRAQGIADRTILLARLLTRAAQESRHVVKSQRFADQIALNLITAQHAEQ